MSKKQRKKSDIAGMEPKKKSGLGALAAVLVVAGAGLVWWMVSGSGGGTAQAGEVVVYKSPTCGCCKDWIKHMEQAGFSVTVHNTNDVDPIKDRYGVPYDMGSCHTAVVDGYVVEGHVPATDVKRMLAEKPAITGLAVPGMPNGAPGMEQGGERDRYKVIAFGPKGNSVFASY